MLREHNCQGMLVFSKEPFPIPAAWEYRYSSIYLQVVYRPALTVIADPTTLNYRFLAAHDESEAMSLMYIIHNK